MLSAGQISVSSLVNHTNGKSRRSHMDSSGFFCFGEACLRLLKQIRGRKGLAYQVVPWKTLLSL